MDKSTIMNLLSAENSVNLLELNKFNELLKRQNVPDDLKLDAIRVYCDTREDYALDEFLELIAKGGYLNYSITFDDLPAQFENVISQNLFYVSLNIRPDSNVKIQMDNYERILTRILLKAEPLTMFADVG